MIDLYSLVKETGVYKTIQAEKQSGRLSHAYLILTADGQNLRNYLKIFARLIMCEKEFPCGECRHCKLIENDAHADVIFYPKDSSINTEEINSLIEESYLLPIEGEKKLFVLCQAQDMNVQAQNKLLKTLEEPPQNVYILLGATSEFPLLPTIKSRVKKLEIPPFSKEKLFSALKEDCIDNEKLKMAISCADGTVGGSLALYNDEGLKDMMELAKSVIVDMQSSKDVLKFSTKILALKRDEGEFLSVLELLLRDMLVGINDGEEFVSNKSLYAQIKDAKGFSIGAIVNALEKITQAQQRKKSNANPTMIIEWVLFQLLEGKYKWQKL